MLGHGRTIILNPIGNVNSGSGSSYNLGSGSSFTNIDYTKSRTIDSIGNTNVAIGSILPAESINYINAKTITSNEHLGSMAGNGMNPNFSSITQPNIFAGQVGTGIERARAFVSSPTMLKSAQIPESSINSGVPIFPGNGPIDTGGLIDPSTDIAYGNARILNEFNTGTQNLMPNAALKTARKFLSFFVKQRDNICCTLYDRKCGLLIVFYNQ